MQQNKSWIDKMQSLQQQQLPDLSQMDNHWAQMQQMLEQPPAATGQSKPRFKKWGWVIGVVIIGLVVGLKLSLSPSAQPIKDNPLMHTPDSKTAVAGAPSLSNKNTPPVETRIGAQKQRIPVMEWASFTPDELANADTALVLGDITINYTPCASCPPADSMQTTVAPQRQLQQLFATLVNEPQLFSINNQHDALIECKGGTALLIPANSLGGSQQISISIKELYTTADIILQQLHAASNKQQLITGGMLQVLAIADGKPIEVKSGYQLRLFMPGSSKEMKGMQLFQGQSSIDQFGKEQVNWLPTGIPFKSLKKPVLKDLEEVAVTEAKPNTYRSNNYLDTSTASYGYFVSGKNDSIQSVGKVPAIQGNAYQFVLDTASTIKVPTQSFQQSNTNGTKDYLQSIKNYGGVDLTQLGWINCDRFYADARPKVNYTIDLGDDASHYHSVLVFKNIRSMLPGWVDGNRVIFYNVPVNETVQIVSIGINQQRQSVLAIQEATVRSSNTPTQIAFAPVNATTLKASLSKMDK